MSAKAKERPHGTYAKYVIERCHCPECREANRLYERRRCRERAERKWGTRPPLYVDAAEARDHLFALSAAGIGPLQVERLAGVGKTAQWKIRSKRVLRVRPETANAILGITTGDHVFMRSMVDAAPAHAIVAELRAMGITKTAIARALGYKAPALQAPAGERCTLRTLRRLEVLRRAVLQAVPS
jgi:hypothetical protein